jgi:hypothetical protein
VTDPRVIADKIRNDPIWFIETMFGERPAIPKQREIMESVRDHKETLVPSCHDSGKTWVAARCLLWFLFAHPNDSIVVSTAPTFTQVVELLWREVRSAYERSNVALGGRLLQTKFELGPKWYATGITSDDPVNYQGWHASNILVVLDEADGIKKEVWNALEGILTSANAKLLAIGNPLDPTSEFAARARDARAPRSKVIRISASEVLPYTDGGQHPYLLQRLWVEDKKEKWGETSALYLGKVEAQWPDQNVDTLIPIAWLMRAKGRAVPRGIRTLGVDVARFGTNRTVRTLLEGNWLAWSKATEHEDAFQTATRVIADIDRYEPAMTAVDETGLGGPVLDFIRRMKRGVPIVGVNNGGQANDPARFANRGAEMWWRVRDAFEKDEPGFSMDDPEGVDELIADLNRPTYEYVRESKIKIDKYGLPHGTSEYGLEPEQRAAVSPDRGDSFVLAYNAARPFIQTQRSRLVTTHHVIPRRREGVLSL